MPAAITHGQEPKPEARPSPGPARRDRRGGGAEATDIARAAPARPLPGQGSRRPAGHRVRYTPPTHGVVSGLSARPAAEPVRSSALTRRVNARSRSVSHGYAAGETGQEHLDELVVAQPAPRLCRADTAGPPNLVPRCRIPTAIASPVQLLDPGAAYLRVAPSRRRCHTPDGRARTRPRAAPVPAAPPGGGQADTVAHRHTVLARQAESVTTML